MKVKIESSKLIKPLYQGIIPPTSDYVSLSVFDKVTYNQHIAVIYAYHPPAPSTAAIELGLRKALMMYREWAGRLGEDNGGNPIILMNDEPIILMNDEGVRFVEASVGHVLAHTMLHKPSSFLLSLHPNLKGVVEIAQVQLTRFSCDSLVVGFTTHQLVADGNSSSNFLVAWGQATRGLKMNPLPFRDRTIFSPRNPPKIEFEHRGADYKVKNFKKTYSHPIFMNYDTEDIVVHKVHYTAEFLAKLKSSASPTNGKRFSTIESLLAHLWRAITRARGLNESELTTMRISVNGRARLNPKVPNEYIGNLVLWAFARAKANDLLHQPLSYAAKLLDDAIIKVNDDYFKSFIDFTNYEKELVPNTGPNTKTLCPDLEVDSWLRFPFYDLDFGHGGPYIFMPSFFPTEGMLFPLPSFMGDGGIEVFVPLFQQSLATFKQICYSLD